MSHWWLCFVIPNCSWRVHQFENFHLQEPTTETKHISREIQCHYLRWSDFIIMTLLYFINKRYVYKVMTLIVRISNNHIASWQLHRKSSLYLKEVCKSGKSKENQLSIKLARWENWSNNHPAPFILLKRLHTNSHLLK